MKITRLPQRHKRSMDDNMIPLINVVFLMLIFFMVAGQISQSDPVQVKLPNSISDKHNHEEPVTITVGLDGQVSFDKVIVPQAQLPIIIKQRFVATENKDAFMLMVKVDGDLPVEKLREVLGQIKQSGIKRVSLATQHLAQE